MNTVPDFFVSLHRPYHQPLKATRWVCRFLESRNTKVKSSELNIRFYLYLINFLSKSYSEKEPESYLGLPSKIAVDKVNDFISGKTQKEQISSIQKALSKSSREGIEKQIFSTYKAASYYVNLAKDKLGLIDSKNNLSNYGKELLGIRSGVGLFEYTRNEKVFYLKRLLKTDFVPFVSLCLFNRLAIRYKIKDSRELADLNFDFLDKYCNIRHFNYTNISLENYNTVRNYWIEKLGVLSKSRILKKSVIKLIKDDSELSNWYDELLENFNSYEQLYFKDQKAYLAKKEKFELRYSECIEEGKVDLGFVNLFDIKEVIKMSHENFESFLNKYYEQEKGRKHIFFNNIVNSVDRRRRFNVRNVPVLKVKIK